MVQTRAGAAVTVTAPANVVITPRVGKSGPGLAAAPVLADTSDLGKALAAADLQLAADFDVHLAARAGPTLAGEPVTVKVDVKADESALLLVETQGGVYAWQYPKTRVRKAPAGLGIAAGGGATLVFELGAASRAGAGPAFGLKDLKGSPIWDWVVEKAVGVLRTRVLKFAVGKIEDAVVEHIEGKLKEGLTSLADDDATLWRADGTPAKIGACANPPRILLMVHGTFSTTTGSFGALTASAAGQAFLETARKDYDAILGFDHKTLARSAEQNAQAMLDALEPLLPKGAVIDAIAYSRGGLVYRTFAEVLLPIQRPDVKLGKAAFVACTNGGTHLAEPHNWESLVDLYTNIVMASSRVIGALTGAGPLNVIATQVIETIASFVKYFAVVGVTDRRLPGLADMEPGSAQINALNQATGPSDGLADYFAVTSNFKAHFDFEKGITKELEQMLLDGVTNRLFQNDNDLVVDTVSMTNFGTRQGRLQNTHVFNYGDREDVYHTVYFAAPETVEKLKAWLI